MLSWRQFARLPALMCLLALPACQITWREPKLEPLNSNRFYAAELPGTCDALESVIADFGLTSKEVRREESACLVETDFRVLADSGDDPIDHLRRIAIIGPGPFIGGRYTVTLTGRGVRDGGSRVKVVARVEGYINEEFGYQVLRSTGLIEGRMFASLGETLGTEPVETR